MRAGLPFILALGLANTLLALVIYQDQFGVVAPQAAWMAGIAAEVMGFLLILATSKLFISQGTQGGWKRTTGLLIGIVLGGVLARVMPATQLEPIIVGFMMGLLVGLACLKWRIRRRAGVIDRGRADHGELGSS